MIKTDVIKSKLEKLQEEARKLELSGEKRRGLNRKAYDYGDEFLENLSSRKAFVQTDNGVSLPPLSEEPVDFSDLLEKLKAEVDSKGLNPASAGHLGYIPGGGLYPSALGDYLAAVSNRYAGVFFSSPGAVHMENQCLRWLCDLIGYGPQAGGNLTSGGSLANLIGLVNARDDSGLAARDFGKATIYCTRQIHHCVIKAIKFAGLQEARLQIIAMDAQFRMQPQALASQIEQDKSEGRQPLAIFASAGTTDVGAVDPMKPIGTIAREEQVWLHLDAAYGGAFLLTAHGQEKMKGLARADSVTIDPHKGLFLPYGTGALLVKDAEKLYASQQMSAHYMQDTHAADGEYSPADLSPELSKHFRGLRLWLPLQLFGIAPFRAALEEKLLLTRYFYREIQQIDDIEVGPPPELSVLFFRYVPASGDANAFNKKLVEAIHGDGRVFLSSTQIEDIFYLRLAVLNFRTHLATIQQAIRIIREKIEELS